MNARKLKKKLMFLSSAFNFWISKKKIDGLKALRICRTIYDGHFFVKINPIWETGSMRKTFISMGNLITSFRFRNRKSITFFVTFTLLLFDRVCLSFNNENALNLKRNHKTNREKSKLSVNKFKTFSWKKISMTYKRVLTTFIILNN